MTEMPFYMNRFSRLLSAFWQQWQHGMVPFSFPARKNLPAYIQYFGKALPSAVFALLVVYSLKDIHFFTGEIIWWYRRCCSCGDGRGSCKEQVCFFPWRQWHGMLHGANKVFIESGKYGEAGEIFPRLLNLELYSFGTPAMICL